MDTPSASSHFVWHDCLTLDIDLALDFFSQLTSWKVTDQTSPNVGRYPIIQGERGAMAGILEMPQFLQDSGVPPYWTGYVHTDLENAAEKIPKLGGQVFTAPTKSIMGTSFVFTDAGGAALAAYEPSASFVVPPASQINDIQWQRLYSRDAEKSAAFYQTLFDWQSTQDDEAGVQTFQTAPGESVGDLVGKPSWIDSDTWVFFIAVEDLLQTASAIESSGGSVVERTTIQGRDAIVAKDSQGGVIGFVGL